MPDVLAGGKSDAAHGWAFSVSFGTRSPGLLGMCLVVGGWEGLLGKVRMQRGPPSPSSFLPDPASPFL